MIDYNTNNKDYLLSIKPSYMFIPISLLITFTIIIISICYFKTYDVYITKGYISCDNTCNITIGVDINDINKIKKSNIIKLNNEVISYNNILVGDIQVDEVNKINIYNVNIEVNQLDNDLINTFQDVQVYSNYESIIVKIKKILF